MLVCAAAGNFPIPAEQLSPNGFRSVIEIDLLGSFHACRAAFDQLRETRGCIIFISAGMAFIPYPYQVHVGAAKAGIDNMMKNLALEWGKYGIRSNSIVPGPIEGTEGMRRLGGEAGGAAFRKGIPLGRYGAAEEIGRAAVFLASPLAAYVTGTVLVVDGGRTNHLSRGRARTAHDLTPAAARLSFAFGVVDDHHDPRKPDASDALTILSERKCRLERQTCRRGDSGAYPQSRPQGTSGDRTAGQDR